MLCTVTIKHSGTVTKFINILVLIIYDATYYDMSDDNIVNLGLKDKPFFKESAEYQSKMKGPFYSIITLTNHYPFTLSEEDAILINLIQVIQLLMVTFKQRII